jgi:glycosyltransferase involved in cell wall biosynthesis
MISVAIIDIIGLTYDGGTLSKRGLGGSESAVILMARELTLLGFDVTVLNNCIDRDAAEGVYDGVKYVDISRLYQHNEFKFDIVISSRTVFPFLKPEHYHSFGRDFSVFKNIKDNARLKVVWLHDTFCQGDTLVERMVVDGDIDELFTLSDFHTTYIGTCNHGHRRMMEVLKRKMFQTRNGATLYPGEVNIKAKDRNLFVYNASVTKGMLPLVNNVWPLVKKAIPAAKLKVIGGYYRFRENAAPDEQEKTWRQMVADPKYAALDIEFTGIIKQSEIAEILKTASFMLYPPGFPETFGISTLESLLYNTPLITGRFGALSETAVEQACYLIDYPVEPNVLYQNIDINAQSLKLADAAINAYHNTYLHQQKMYYCNIVKGIHGWDSVALQWKQHFYKKLGYYLSVNEYRRVSEINTRVHRVYGRRFANMEEFYIPRKAEQQCITVITPVYNAEKYISQCIASVATQDYANWKMIIIDDASTDNTVNTIWETIIALPREIQSKISVVENSENKGAVYNQVTNIAAYAQDDSIVVLLDGDDTLVNDNQVFHFYNNLYDGTTEFTYGSCWSMVDNIPLIAQPYPEEVKQNRTYRSHKFNWNMPYTHLRTFKAYLLKDIQLSHFQDKNGNWYKAGGDGAVFYALIEKADPNKVKAVTDVVYNYNDINPLNDYKVNGDEQTRTANQILTRTTL